MVAQKLNWFRIPLDWSCPERITFAGDRTSYAVLDSHVGSVVTGVYSGPSKVAKKRHFTVVTNQGEAKSMKHTRLQEDLEQLALRTKSPNFLIALTKSLQS